MRSKYNVDGENATRALYLTLDFAGNTTSLGHAGSQPGHSEYLASAETYPGKQFVGCSKVLKRNSRQQEKTILRPQAQTSMKDDMQKDQRTPVHNTLDPCMLAINLDLPLTHVLNATSLTEVAPSDLTSSTIHEKYVDSWPCCRIAGTFVLGNRDNDAAHYHTYVVKLPANLRLTSRAGNTASTTATSMSQNTDGTFR